MGFLDNSSVTVDAILTKQGRRLLAEGVPVNITSFQANDDGIDYTLWNPDHPSGSAYYDEAITNMPQLEATPHAEFKTRNKLATLPRGTTALPILYTTPEKSYSFTFQEDLSITAETLNFANEFEYYMILPDSSIAEITSHAVTTIAGVGLQFLNETDIPYAQMAFGASPFVITPHTDGTERKMMVTIVGAVTGVSKTISITVPDNFRTVPLPGAKRG